MRNVQLRRILLVGTLLFSGCVVVHDRHHPPGRALGHRKHAHVHGARCGHVWHDGRWVTVSVGHVHAPGCGHWYANGRWHLRAPG